MSFVLKPWQLWVVALAGWINQQQQEVIEYLRTENRVLKEILSEKTTLGQVLELIKWEKK